MARNAPADGDTTVQAIVDRYLSWCERNRSASTLEWYQLYLGRFSKHLGHLPVSKLKPSHIEDWLSEQYGHCSDNGKNGAVRAVMRPFNWLVKRGEFDRNPIVGVERPQFQSHDVYIESEDWDRLMVTVSGSLRDILTILQQTGCRPNEARNVTARHVDRNMRAWVFNASESKGKRHRRVIPLNDAAWEITQRLMLKHPTGPLFRDSRDGLWTSTALGHRLQKIGEWVGVKITPYHLRHTDFTTAVENGVLSANLKDLPDMRPVEVSVQPRGGRDRAAFDATVTFLDGPGCLVPLLTLALALIARDQHLAGALTVG